MPLSRIAILVTAVVAAGLGVWLALDAGASRDRIELETVALLPEARQLPDFRLRAAGGTSVELEDLRGRWSIVFLGFTHCPDICPTTLAELGQAEALWRQSLDADERPRIVFVSADPERDSPEAAQEYAGYFSDDAIGVTGDVPALERFARSLMMVFMKVEQEDGYTIDHSTQLSILDPEGHFVAYARPRPASMPGPAFPPRALANDMVRLVESRR